MSTTIGSGYDLSATTFSPEGRIFQVEYAQKAVDEGPTCIGIVVKDGIVLATEKRPTTNLVISGKQHRISHVELNAGIVASGYLPDCRQLINRARQECKNYRSLTDETIPAKVLNERMALFVQAHTVYSGYRPFGSSALLGVSSNDKKQPYRLFLIEPSGQSYGYFSCAIGMGRQVARSELEKIDLNSIGVIEAVKKVSKILMEAAQKGDPDKRVELEVSWISDATEGRHEYIPDELLKEALDEAREYTLNLD